MEKETSQSTFFNERLLDALAVFNNLVFNKSDRRSALQESANLVQVTTGSERCRIVLTDSQGGEIERFTSAGNGQDGRWKAPQAGELSQPLTLERKPIGFVCIEQSSGGPFSLEAQQTLTVLARHISITLERLESVTSRGRLQQLNELMREMAEANEVKSLLGLILRSGAGLIGAPRGAISRLNLSNGELTIEDYIGPGPDLQIRTLRPGQGVINEALKSKAPILVDDVRKPEWKHRYVDFWSDTRSELAVPIVLKNATVRIGSNVERAGKPIGVLDVESPQIAAFTQEDADLLSSLASYAAVLIEGLETDGKQGLVAKIQQTILEKTDWDSTMDVVLKSIKDTLGYDYVNISLVKPDAKRIKTEYLIGIPDKDIEEFKRLADHPLETNGVQDIQASIVKSRQIEVPARDDPRFDRTVYEKFGHDRMIRVFVPMIAPSDDRVMGTVEAGYRFSEHRTYIYEQDVQILKGFIDYAARALERRQSLVLEKIGHEFRTPVVGIRNNASFLQRRHGQLGDQIVERKCDDILTDCEILLSQIAQLEHILGKPLPPPKIERSLVFRDVIIKTVHQLGPLVQGQGFDIKRLDYGAAGIYKISPVWIDKSRLSQVFFNLLINSIKYAESDPSAFNISIDVEETRDAWLIKVRDWGIGVRPEYAEKIFDEGYRTPEAKGRNVTGSGLGLTIARQYMRMIGGDVKLTGYKDPTEFQVILPKNLMKEPKEEENDPAH